MHVYVKQNTLTVRVETVYAVDVASDKVKDEISRAGTVLARKGASKGGKARAAKLSPERRREIASRAIEERWRRYRAARGLDSPSGQAKALPSKRVADLGWSREEAAEIRASLLAFEEDWSAPGMELYDTL